VGAGKTEGNTGAFAKEKAVRVVEGVELVMLARP